MAVSAWDSVRSAIIARGYPATEIDEWISLNGQQDAPRALSAFPQQPLLRYATPTAGAAELYGSNVSSDLDFEGTMAGTPAGGGTSGADTTPVIMGGVAATPAFFGGSWLWLAVIAAGVYLILHKDN